MAGDEETGSEAKLPFGTPRPSHREPPIISGEAIHVPDAESEAVRAVSPDGDEALRDAAAAEIEEEGVSREDAAARTAAAEAYSQSPPPVAPSSEPARPARSALALPLTILLALGGGFAGAYAERHWFEGDQQPDLTPINARLAAMDSKIAASENKLAADEKKLAAVETAKPATTAITPDALAPLQTRLSDVEAAVKQALAAATAAQQQAAAQPAGGDVGEAQQQAIASAVAPPDLTPLQTRIDALEQRSAGIDALQKQVAGLDQRFSGFDKRLAGLDALQQQAAQIEPLDQRLKQVEGTLNAPKVAARAPEEPEVKQDPKDANAPALAIIAENLVRKVSAGVPFATETAALENLGLDKAKLADLQPIAAKGIVPVDGLSKQFATLAPTLSAAREKEEGSIFDRWMHHAAGLVRISRVDDLSGDDLPSRVARIQNALAHGDLDRALQDWSALPEDAKTKSADWAATARASAKAIATAKAISAETIERLSKVKS